MNKFGKIGIRSMSLIATLAMPSLSYAGVGGFDSLVIYDRTQAFMTNIRLKVDFVSSQTSLSYTDYEDVNYWKSDETLFFQIDGYAAYGCQSSPCTGDLLYLEYAEYGQNTPIASIGRLGSEYSQMAGYLGSFSNMTVTLSFNIGGACYTDWESVGSWPVDQDLALYLDLSNPQKGSDNCYHGDFLHH